MQARPFFVTADDLGRTPGINHAITAWQAAGALNRASLMVNECAAAEAATLARSWNHVQIGLHLTLCDGVDSTGHPLPISPVSAGLRYAFWPGSRAWLKKEITAQFQRFLDFGLKPSHWDGHTHLHLHPIVLAVTLPIAMRLGFHTTRLVHEPGPPALQPWIFQRLSQRAAPGLQMQRIAFTEFTFGLRKTGRIDQATFATAIQTARQHSVEIYLHPGAEQNPPSPMWVAEQLRKAGMNGFFPQAEPR